MKTLILILLIAVGSVAFLCAGVSLIWQFFKWLFLVAFQFGKVAFILFLVWAFFACLVR